MAPLRLSFDRPHNDRSRPEIRDRCSFRKQRVFTTRFLFDIPRGRLVWMLNLRAGLYQTAAL